jgi:hypothetical protein
MTEPMNPTTQQYIVECEDGHNYSFSAVDDSQAIGLCQRNYPDEKWAVYRMAHGEKLPICTQSPQCDNPPPIAEPPSPPPAYG